MIKLEKNKREVAFCSLVAITLICFAVNVIAYGTFIEAFIVIPYITSAYVFVKLYNKGVAGVVSSFANIVLYWAFFLISTIFFKAINLDSDFHVTLQLICCFPIWYATYKMKMNETIENYITKKLYKIDIENSKIETNNIKDYAKYETLQEIKSYTAEPYAITRCSLEQRALRLAGCIAILIAPYFNYANVDYILLIITMIFAFTIIKYGYIRASIITLILYGFEQFVAYLKPVYMLNGLDVITYMSNANYIPRRIIEMFNISSPILKSVLASLVIFAVIYMITKMAFKAFRQSKTYINIQTYKKDNLSKSFDVFLKEIAPIRLYTKVACVEIPIAENKNAVELKEIATLNNIVGAIHLEAIDNEFVIAGTEVDTQNNVLKIIIYLKEQDSGEVLKIVNEVVKENGKVLSKFDIEDDPNWSKYFDEIIPDKYVSQEMYNKKYLEVISSLDIQSEDMHKVLYYFYFKNKKDIKEFLKEMKEAKYNVESVDDLLAYKNMKYISSNYQYGVVISHESRLGQYRINMITKDLIDNASKNNGVFDGWALSELLDLKKGNANIVKGRLK